MSKLEFNIHGVDYVIDPLKNDKMPNGIDFWVNSWIAGWEQKTFELFEKVKDKETNAIDIGGWIGATPIWLAKNFNELLVIEADKLAVKYLKANLKSSKCNNTVVIDKPIYSTDKELVFGINTDPNFKDVGLAYSTSQIKNDMVNELDYKIKAVTLADMNDIFPFSKVSFVKVDIEGGEEYILIDLIKNAERYHWKLLLSFHYLWWKDANIEKYNNLFSNCKCNMVLDTNEEVPNESVMEYISQKSNQFYTMYFDF